MKAKLVKDVLTENEYLRRGQYVMHQPQYEEEDLDLEKDEEECEECE